MKSTFACFVSVWRKNLVRLKEDIELLLTILILETFVGCLNITQHDTRSQQNLQKRQKIKFTKVEKFF